MAVFTAIATAIVGAIGLTGFAATLATSIIAGGLALGTAKVLGVFKPPQMGSQADPGVKIQLPPATDNKLPVFYGRSITGSIIVDAEIKNSNNTMVYVMCIGEQTDSGNYSISKIYRDDQTLNFGTSTSSHIVQSVTDPNATSSTQVAGKMRCRVYAGGTAAGNQIFPTTGVAQPSTSLCSTITGSTSYANLVYAVFEIDYDPENGLTGLGAINFDINNDLNEPSNVMLDYLQNTRYGAGISSSDLDLTSFNALYDYSTAQVSYTTSAGAGATHDRWQIDGMLSTYVDVKQNIDSLCQSCAAFFTYNPKEAKFGVVPNRQATSGEKTAAYTLTDNNILGDIKITSTDLYGLYNEIEAEYPAVVKKDQTDVVFVTTPTADRNNNEPDNKLTTRYALVNDSTRVENLANIDLRQSRTSTVVELTADYSAIQVDAGDVVKLTNSEYGFSDKLFRAMRVTEAEDDGGMLNTQLVLLEYADDIYTHGNVQQRLAPGLSGISSYGNYFGNANIDLGNVYVNPDLDGDGNADVIDPDNGNLLDQLPPDLIPVFNGPFGPITGPWVGINYSFPDDTYYDAIEIAMTPQGVLTNATVSPTVYTFTPPAGTSTFNANNNPTLGIPISGLGQNDFAIPNVDTVQFTITGKDYATGLTSASNTTANISVLPQNYVSKTAVATFTAGVQIEDAPAANLSVVSGTTFLPIIPTENYDLSGAEVGDYSISGYGTLAGAITGAFDLGWGVEANIYFANATTVTMQPTALKITTTNITDFPPQSIATYKVSTDPTTYAGVANDMTAANVDITLVGFSDIGSSNAAPRGFFGMKYEMLHVTKGERL
jgi:hypothetical protein